MQRAIAVLLLIAVARLTMGASEADITLPELDPLDHPVGEIVTAGSSTVFPLSERMAERWTEEGGLAPSNASINAGAGFVCLCVEGKTDISKASRAIRDSEREVCKAIGRDSYRIARRSALRRRCRSHHLKSRSNPNESAVHVDSSSAASESKAAIRRPN